MKKIFLVIIIVSLVFTACKKEEEIFQNKIENNVLYCKTCKKKSLVQLISKPSFILKGTGWYASDFKNKISNKE